VRNSATIGGNVCNASPAGDLIIPLILLDAEVELASWSGGSIAVRAVPLCDFFLGPGMTRMEANELVVAFRFALPDERFVAVFNKFGTRPALDIAIVSLGIAGTRRNGALESARVAFGAVAPIPLRGRKTEAAIEQQPLTDEVITGAVETALEEISPISDVRASAWYRKRLIRVLTERLLRDVNQRRN
jgi:CO/xanthine dehydrogenase FAD-binding subunit